MQCRKARRARWGLGPVLLGAALIAGCGSPRTVRFVAVGDTGRANQEQLDVAKAIADKCAKDGCDFVQLLGDNIYDSGIESPDDPQMQSKFEDPYKGIDLPFYVVLGNHDYGGGGSGAELDKGQHEVAYTTRSQKWRLPDNIYAHLLDGVDLYALDTNLLMYSVQVERQKEALRDWLASSTATWRIAMGHHPYLSNGTHGNAGTYDNLGVYPIFDGRTVFDFFNESVCGNVDVYLCGHDHSRQWLADTCRGTELIVSGAGSSVTALPGQNKAHFQKSTLGFVYITIQDRTFTAEFLDANGTSEFKRTLQK
ncbi:MAG: metallophosphoesterase [Polyangia bacterium]